MLNSSFVSYYIGGSVASSYQLLDKYTVLKYLPLQSTVTLKPGLGVIQGH